jgi:hypothetical protein
METISSEKIITVNSGNVRAEADALCITFNEKEHCFTWATLSEQLQNATPQQRSNFTISPSGYGIHWNELDEDISIHSLLK